MTTTSPTTSRRRVTGPSVRRAGRVTTGAGMTGAGTTGAGTTVRVAAATTARAIAATGRVPAVTAGRSAAG